jgi:hypothetical protein
MHAAHNQDARFLLRLKNGCAQDDATLKESLDNQTASRRDIQLQTVLRSGRVK